MVLGPGIMQGFNTIVVAVIAVGFMLYISPLLTLIVLLAAAPVRLRRLVLGQRIHTGFEDVQSHFAKISAMAQENLAGVRVVRAYAQESAQTARFDTLNGEYVEKNARLIRLFSVFYPAMGFLAALGIVIVLEQYVTEPRNRSGRPWNAIARWLEQAAKGDSTSGRSEHRPPR